MCIDRFNTFATLPAFIFNIIKVKQVAHLTEIAAMQWLSYLQKFPSYSHNFKKLEVATISWHLSSCF